MALHLIADDLVLISRSAADLQKQLTTLQNYSEKWLLSKKKIVNQPRKIYIFSLSGKEIKTPKNTLI